MRVLILFLTMTLTSYAADLSNGVNSDIPADCHGCRVCWESHHCGFGTVIKDPIAVAAPGKSKGAEKASEETPSEVVK